MPCDRPRGSMAGQGIANKPRSNAMTPNISQSGEREAPIKRLAYSIDEFCHAHGISRATYFVQRRLGKGPREMRVGNRVLVSLDAAFDWRRERENDGEAK